MITKPKWQPPLFIKASIAIHLFAILSFIFVPKWWVWALGFLLLNHVLIMMLGLWPRSQWLGKNWTRLPDSAAARNEIALTIDDGPDPEVTPQVLDILDRYAIKATFFCVGEKAARYPELCREMINRGHALENHSQYHRHYFSLLGPKAMTKELEAAQQTLTTITKQRPLFFRAPAGLRNPFLDPVLTKLGLTLVSWTTRGFDTKINDINQIKTKLIRHLQAGVILLLHDGNAARTLNKQPVIVEVLPDIIKCAIARGLRFVTLRDA